MFKLPQCPHCNTIFRYGDVRRIMSKKKIKCYHCDGDIFINKKKFLILFLEIALICAIFNVLELYMVGTISFIALCVTNVLFLTVGIFLMPFFVKFEKSDKKLNNRKNKLKNKK